MTVSKQNIIASLFHSIPLKRSGFWHSNTIPLVWLGLSIMTVGLVRSQIIPYSASKGAPIDETFHFGRVIDTVALLNRWGIGSDRPQFQVEFQQTNAMYVPQDLLPYSIFNDYWQGIGIYVVQALVQLVVSGVSLAERLYLARFVNVCGEAALAVIAYTASASVLRTRRVALVLAGLLSFVPTVSTSAASVTTEVAAFVACLVLFAALVYLHKFGWSSKVTLWLLFGTLGCLLTKNTSWPMIGVVIYMILRRAGVSGWVFLAGVLLLVVGAATQFRPQGAAHWYRDSWSWEAWQGYDIGLAPVDRRTSRLGDASLKVVDVHADRPLIQHLPESSLLSLQGQMVTIGSWVRAPVGTAILLPVLQQAENGSSFVALPQTETIITASGDWQFAQYHVLLPSRLDYARIALWQTPDTQTPVWYDGLVMVVANIPEGSPPEFSSGAATKGIWNDQPFVNLLQNGSAESQWWGVDSSRWTIEFPVNQRLFAWQDGSRTVTAYLTAVRAIFVTLWGSFQNDIPGLTRWQMAGIGLSLAIGLVSCLFYGVPLKSVSSQRPISNWVLECWLVWLGVYVAMDLVRADVSGAWVNPYFYSSGRFIIPTLFPLLGLTLTGLSDLLPRPQRNWILAGLVAAMFLVNVWMLLRVESPYYHCLTSPRWSCIATLY